MRRGELFSDHYIGQVNGVKLADIMFSLLCVCVSVCLCVCAHMAAVFHTQYIQSYGLQI